MADLRKRLGNNAPGLFFVDATCINCGVSRHYAPDLFGDDGDHAFVLRQPTSPEERLRAEMALLACPVGSIGTTTRIDSSAAREAFPYELAPDIHVNGFNSRKSFGAHSYFIRSETGNWLIDSPRYTRHLVDRFEQWGGLRWIFLTHRDDVADAHRFASRFGAERIIHARDVCAQPDAEIVVRGEERRIGHARIIATPGHTEGHAVMLWRDAYLFTGDHFAWVQSEGRFRSFRGVCWYSWEAQIESVRKLARYRDVSWIFPGHGMWHSVDGGAFPTVVADAVEWMESVA
jgi:glyoxylase-like metal-dependent hydrolase (beta-lactamase superfamily II)/ferredoxin